MEEQGQFESKHKSTLQVCLMGWNISLSSYYFGYTMIYLGVLPFETITSLYNININTGIAQGILQGSIPVGALFGALLNLIIIQRISRKNILLITNLIAFLLGIFIYIPNFYSFLFFRFCQGICVGIFSSVAPLILREIAPVPMSGILGSFVQLNIAFGLLIGYLFTYIFKKITGDLQGFSYWHIIFALALPTIVFQTFVLIFIYPYETPKYLLLQRRQGQAIQLLQFLYKSQYVWQVLQEKRNDIRQLQTLRLTKSTVQNKFSLASLMSIHIASLQQMSGTNSINFYFGPILNRVVPPEVSILIPTLVYTFRLIISFTSIFFISQFGRKTILQSGLLGLALATSLITIGLRNSTQQSNEVIAIIGLFLYVGAYGISLGPISWIYIAQTAQPSTIPLSIIANWTSASLVIIFFPILKENVLKGDPTLLFAFFTCWLLASFVVNHFWLLQTKDKTQQQIREAYLEHKVC